MQFNLAVLSHYSYLLISGKEALVVDPGRDVEAYLEAARKAGAEIKGVFLTHSHADFVAGHMEMAKAVGCPIFFGDASAPLYPHKSIKEGSVITVGEAQVRILETPGHTPDGLCGVVSAKSAPDKPEMMFSGDTLFVGSVGRPDLMGGTTSAAELAGMMFDTWNQKLSKLPDTVQVLPAHGAGSLCGAHLSDDPSSTIGRERTSNAYLKFSDSRSAFISSVLDGLPDAPQYFKHNAKMNHDGPELVNWKGLLSESASPSETLMDAEKSFVVDLRGAKEFADGHIPNSVNIALRGRLETWVGIIVPWGSNVILCGSTEEIKEAAHRLQRVGYRAGFIRWESWKKSELPQLRNAMIKPAELYSQMQKGTAPIIVDVRLPSEWMGLRIGQVINLPLNQLGELAPKKLNQQEPVVAVCNSAYRSNLAIGILERVGFKLATSMEGGSEAWIEAGFPVVQAEKSAGAVSGNAEPAQLRQVNLPDRISPAELKRLVIDLPGSFELIDLRPAPQSADYKPLGARAVDVVEVMTNPVFLVGEIPLIIVDRDGSIALMVAGILSQKTKRPIKVLYGGMEAYWAESELQQPGSVSSGMIGKPSSGAHGSGIVPIPAPSSAPVPAQPAKPKKKSAGC
ncbi:MAG: MBL fold metallo-hydrolase [Candidatus Riflebacteria bacterium]|nr:MBL fold metallo-hydrolase [Candidatus Riflebacteria bacterium]